jgi:prepilin-type N-terminal cleavage/methylation domain-containing protein
MRKRANLKKRRGQAGFTLVELIVASVISSVVLIGMFSIMTSMVSAEIDGMRNGTVTSWSLAGIGVLNADISGAGAIGYPASGVADDSLVVCTNWSTRTAPPAVVDSSAGNTVYSYCLDTTDGFPLKNTLLRNVAINAVAACPTVAKTPCTVAGYSDAANTAPIVATGVYRDPNGDSVFLTDPNTMNAVRLRFVVGNPAASSVSAGSNGGTVTAQPVSVPFNTEIILED